MKEGEEEGEERDFLFFLSSVFDFAIIIQCSPLSFLLYKNGSEAVVVEIVLFFFTFFFRSFFCLVFLLLPRFFFTAKEKRPAAAQ